MPERGPGAGGSRHRVALPPPGDVEGWLQALARVVARGLPPDAVTWDDGGAHQASLFDTAASVPGDAIEPGAALSAKADAVRRRWPRAFVELMHSAALHDSPDRHATLHALAWALQRDPRAWHDRLHPERLAAERLAREVRHEVHRMHAFVRFRPVTEGGQLRHVAWYEPAHHVVRAAAPFFQKRFAAMHWAILTPRGSVSWDRQQLTHGPAAPRHLAPPADAGEALWLAYYRSIFNPARANGELLRRHMPVRYWAQLPEAVTFAPLLRLAPQRTQSMLQHAADTRRRLPRATAKPADPSPPDTGDDAGLRRARLRSWARRAAACDRCPAAQLATQTVFGRGAPDARVMLVGEQPGDREDLVGRPFVGPAGQLLQRAVADLGWPLQQLYVTNAVKHFHYTVRGKRRLHKTPAQQAVAECLDWLEAEIETVDPSCFVALGRTAEQALLRGKEPLEPGQARQRADGRWVLLAWHPALLLRAGVKPDDPALPTIELYRRWLQQLAPATRHFDTDGGVVLQPGRPGPTPSPDA